MCALVTSAGAVVASYTYDAWGNVSATINYSLLPVNFSNRFLFHGGWYSEATGLYQFRARWYAPELGRWLSPDPIGLEGGLNLYEFCGNDPVNRVDPLGLCDEMIPVYPPWVDIDENISMAQNMIPVEFYFFVRSGGPWDYKQYGPYEEFGNWHFAVTGRAAGFFEQELRRGAGWAQRQAGTSRPEWGHPAGRYPYGDEPRDQRAISNGFDYWNGLREQGYRSGPEIRAEEAFRHMRDLQGAP